jgi:hypothetical protein
MRPGRMQKKQIVASKLGTRLHVPNAQVGTARALEKATEASHAAIPGDPCLPLRVRGTRETKPLPRASPKRPPP